MSEATVTSKGQITLPKDIRDRLGLRKGDRVRFVVDEDGRVRLLPAKRDISSLVGILPRPGRARSIKEMDEAIAKHVTEKFKRHDRD